VRKILEACPTCGGPLTITEVRCDRCATEVRSQYQPCPFCRLSPEQMNFILLFVQNRGNLSDLEKTLGVSYPTIRGKLEEIIRIVAPAEASGPVLAAAPAVQRRDILARIATGKLSAAEGLDALRTARSASGPASAPQNMPQDKETER
jgi:hypothetical protein